MLECAAFIRLFTCSGITKTILLHYQISLILLSVKKKPMALQSSQAIAVLKIDDLLLIMFYGFLFQ